MAFGATLGFSPAQDQAIEQSASSALGPVASRSGETLGQITSAFGGSLGSSGMFTPQEIAALQQAGAWDPHGAGFTEQTNGNVSPFLSALLSSVGKNYGPDYAAQQAATAASAQPTSPAYSLSPSTIASQFPGGLPTVNPTTINPAAIQNVSAQQIMNPGSIIAGMGGASAYSPASMISAVQNYSQPLFAQQDAATQAALANAGIVGGTSSSALAQLGQSQQNELMSQIQPYLQQEQALEQQGVTGDIANQLATEQTNQSAALQAAEANQGAGLQAGEYNATNAQNAENTNVSNALSTASTDATSYNAMLQFLAGLQNQDWLAQLGAASNLAGEGLSATSGAYQPNYTNPSAVNLSGIGSLYGQLAGANKGFNTAPVATITETPQEVPQ